MDRPLEQEFVSKQKRKRWLKIAVPVVVVVAGYMTIAAWVTPSVSRSDIRIAKAYTGLFEGTLSANGTVLPEFEEVLTSPVETRLVAVLKYPGEHLMPGTQILQLDMSELKLALERTEKDLALKQNAIARMKLDMEHSITDLKSQLHIKDLRLSYLKSKSEQQKKMFEIGAVSKDQLDQAVMEEQIASIEREDMEKSGRNTEASLKSQLDGLTTEAGSLGKERSEIQRQVDMLSCKSMREGVLTWTVKDIGAAIHKGDPIAKIADLSGYRVDAVMSDVNAARLTPGQAVRVRINDTYLNGTIANIFPAIENGVVKFSVALKDKSNKLLRSNLQVDVFVVTSGTAQSLLVEKGPFLTGEAEQQVFVVHNDHAIRTPVHIGAISFDRVEIAAGLQPDDEIIISDMKDYLHLKELRLK